MDEARRLAYLAAMGIRAWKPRDLTSIADARPAVEQGGADAAEEWRLQTGPASVPASASAQGLKPVPPPTPAQAAAAGQHSSQNGSSSADTAASAVPGWRDEPPPWDGTQAPDAKSVPRSGPGAASHALAPAARSKTEAESAAAGEISSTTASIIATLDWDALQQRVADCRACRLCETRNHTVFGIGNRSAQLMFIGEGPGEDEDRQGEPFVGRAGQLLNKMLMAIGLSRDDVYIANIVKCRPPRNRNPAAEEAAACRAYLERQIALIQPRLIVSLGAVSANNLLNNTESVGRLRGRVHHYRSSSGEITVPLMVTYHPSYYLRSPAEKAKGWKDLQLILTTLRTISADAETTATHA